MARILLTFAASSMRRLPWSASLLLVLALSWCAPAYAVPPELQHFALPNGETMDVRVVHANGPDLILWLPCDQGIGSAELQAAQEIGARHGIEVWLADILGTYFMPVAPSSMRQIQGEEVLAVLQHLADTTDKRIFLVSAGFGSIPTLRGARDWHRATAGTPRERRLGGIVLLYPELHAREPEPGKPMEYLPIVDETSTPLAILQPALTPGRFWLDPLVKRLEAGGSTVHTHILPKVRGYFFVRTNPSEAEIEATRALPDLIVSAIDELKNAAGSPP